MEKAVKLLNGNPKAVASPVQVVSCCVSDHSN